MAEFVKPIISKPGVKRDGTLFEGDYYTDAEWCRFQRGLPRKMGGYVAVFDALNEIQRGAIMTAANSANYLHSGSASLLARLIMDDNGLPLGYVNRTPSGFVADDDNTWQFTVIYDPTGAQSQVFAHAAPNLASISSDTTGKVYYGNLTDVTMLTELVGADVSGGICSLYPYMFRYGSDGFIGWSDRGDPLNLTSGDANALRVTGEKVVLGIPTRAGGGNAPAGLFWANDALVRASFIGGSALFAFDRISEGYSILSPSAVVEYNGVFYWPGSDGRFLAFNGIINELDNPMNRNWFFDNLNWAYSQKVWGTRVPAFGEIWWFYPRGDATECSHVIIYNVKEKTWYDSATATRSCGVAPRTFRRPLWFSSTNEIGAFTALFMHEYGADKILSGQSLAVRSFFETANTFIPLETQSPQGEINTVIKRIEPDFVQTGDMTLTIKGREFAQSDDIVYDPITYSDTEEYIAVDKQLRQMRFAFESNVAGGDYQMGQIVGIFDGGDSQP